MAQQDLYFGSAARPRDWVTKDRAYTFTFKAYSSGTQQVPSSATITIRKPGGAALSTPVSAASVTVDGSGNMTYTLIAGNTSDLGAGYIADVVYVVSGATYDGRFLFDVCRVPLHNVVIAADLGLHQYDYADYLNSGETAMQHITRAFQDVCGFLHGRGQREYLVLNSEELRDAIEYASLARIFGSHLAASGDRTAALHEHYRNLYAAALTALGPKLVYDLDQSGTADGLSLEGPSGEEGAISTGYRIRH